MADNFNNNDNIELNLPLNAAYVSAVRLTASSIANRLNYEINDIEDIKAAVSEACAYVIEKKSFSHNTSFKINFFLNPEAIKIQLILENVNELKNNDNELSLIMIKALMDHTDLSLKDATLRIIMEKKHKKRDI